MSTPIAEDFSHIAAELKRIESEKGGTRPIVTPMPEVQPDYSWSGGMYVADYDPA